MVKRTKVLINIEGDFEGDSLSWVEKLITDFAANQPEHTTISLDTNCNGWKMGLVYGIKDERGFFDLETHRLFVKGREALMVALIKKLGYKFGGFI